MQARAPCDIVITIDSDHSPFLSTPDALTDALLTVTRRFEQAQPRNWINMTTFGAAR
jgi:hypothetical protein